MDLVFLSGSEKKKKLGVDSFHYDVCPRRSMV